MVKWMIPLLFWLKSNLHIDVDGAKILKNQNYPKEDSHPCARNRIFSSPSR